MLNASEASSPVLLSDEADEVNGATDANEGADGREASDGDGVMWAWLQVWVMINDVVW